MLLPLLARDLRLGAMTGSVEAMLAATSSGNWIFEVPDFVTRKDAPLSAPIRRNKANLSLSTATPMQAP